MILVDLRTGLMVRLMAGGTMDSTFTNGRIDKHRNRDLSNQHGNNWVISTTRREVVNSQTNFPHIRPGVSHRINENYCVSAPMCRWLTQGKEAVNSVDLYQHHQTGPHEQQKNCKLVSVSPDQCPERQ